ncbi:MAG: hypothetical protein ACLR8L_00395 [Oscillospiraceae bacterium]
MVDLQLMASAPERAEARSCRLILVGDPDQLPLGWARGIVFADLIRSGTRGDGAFDRNLPAGAARASSS